MKKHDYLVASFAPSMAPNDLDAELDKLGEDGWLLSQIIHGGTTWIFTREAEK